MPAVALRCINCKQEFPLENIYSCPVCRGILDVRYEYGLPDTGDILVSTVKTKKQLWRYGPFLPINDYTCVVSLGEGGTPLLKSKRIGPDNGLSNLFFKNETANPTGSFKDRPTSVGVSKAVEHNCTVVAIASSGNAGTSAAAYCAHSGIPAVVCVPESVPAEKLHQALAYGAKVARVWGTYSDCFNLVAKAAEKYRWANVTSTMLNPYTLEGDKTVAYELAADLGKAPEWIFVPIGAGALLVGILKGFKELLELSLVDKLPRMVGVQSAECAPIVRAFESGLYEVKSWKESINSVASGIADPLIGYEQDGTYTLSAIWESNGIAVASDNLEILDSVRKLAREEGLFCEPSGAVGIGPMLRLLRTGVIKPEDTVVQILTGHGLKDVKALADDKQEAVIVSDIEELAELAGFDGKEDTCNV